LHEGAAQRLLAKARNPWHKFVRTIEILWKSRSG
jgi:hypothetical protein